MSWRGWRRFGRAPDGMKVALSKSVLPTPRSPALFLGLLAGVWGYAVLRQGGIVRGEWNFCLLALGLTGLLYWVRTPRSEFAPPLDRKLRWLIVLFACYVAFQLLPLPVALLRILSPARAELQEAVAAVVPGPSFAPLSVVPRGTLSYFARIAGYTSAFLLVREIAWRLPERPWLPVFPILAVAGLEAALGLLQYGAGGADAHARGTYINRNHFSGLLEMALPFAVMYPAVILRRVRSRFRSQVRPVVKACGVLAVAALIFLGIVYSLSRMGFVAALCSLFLMATLALGAGLPRGKKLLAGGLIAALIVLSFVFLPPDRLIARFAQLSSTEGITAEGRLLLWGETVSLIAAYPLFGCGLGGYESAFLKYKVSEPLVRDDYAHNDYLQFLAELGGVGFLIAGALMIVVLGKAVRAASERFEPDRRYLALACAGAMAAILIHSTVDFNLYIPANALLLAWISGISAGFPRACRSVSVRQVMPVPRIIELEGTKVVVTG